MEIGLSNNILFFSLNYIQIIGYNHNLNLFVAFEAHIRSQSSLLMNFLPLLYNTFLEILSFKCILVFPEILLFMNMKNIFQNH